MQQSTTFEILDKNEIQDPLTWIKNNIVNSTWRQTFFQKIGIKQDEKVDLQLDFISRTNEEVRSNYIQKLQNNKLFEKIKKDQTLTIFDWDDTLLCTTYLGGYGFTEINQDVWDQLSILNDSAARLLETASKHGDVFIITNAAQGWVEYSSKLYMNKVFQVIFDKKIQVISARAGYEDQFPGECSKWKVEAFKDIKTKFNSDIFTNIICLGDSNIEIDAAHVLAKQQIIKVFFFLKREFNVALIKTIKFRESPKPDELVKQQDLVTDKFDQIYSTFKNLTIRLEKKVSNQ